MSFYFMSHEANDRGYDAEIGKDKCRGLKAAKTGAKRNAAV